MKNEGGGIEDPEQSIAVSMMYLLRLHKCFSLCDHSHGGLCKKNPKMSGYI